MDYAGLNEINGFLVVLEDVENPVFDEIVRLKVSDGDDKIGRVVRVHGNKTIVQVFQGASGLSLKNTVTRFTGAPMKLKLSDELLGRVFDGMGRPIDGLGEIYAETMRPVNGWAINPVSRVYPRNFIQTGISAIDGLTTLIRGQKLPIFSGDGMPHDRLAAQIVRQASLGSKPSGGGRPAAEGRLPGGRAGGGRSSGGRPATAAKSATATGSAIGIKTAVQDEKFAVVFAAMGVKHDVAEFFRRSFEESGAISHVVMFLNLAGDPVAERIITPRAALTAAEYLAYEKGIHVLVVMTDITAYAEALREISSSRDEIPSRKGYPGYLYSDLASLFERAGVVRNSAGSITQIPILTMPNDDITHPVPDLTGYITEGQIVLDRRLMQKGIYPPINILPSLSRLMKDGIGEGYTRPEHPELANQLFSCYAHVGDIRALASVIGEDELSDVDKKYMAFGRSFEEQFVSQDVFDNRSIEETLELAWDMLGMLPISELDRIKPEFLEKRRKKKV